MRGEISYLKQEIVSLLKVDHPNIVKIHEIFKNKKKVYIVMEKAPGMDLLDYLFTSKTMSENTASQIIKQVLKVIQHLNSKNLCHRDIKLENLIIDPETLDIKVVDFGFSGFYNDKEMLHTKVGTPYYISPQVLHGEYSKE